MTSQDYITRSNYINELLQNDLVICDNSQIDQSHYALNIRFPKNSAVNSLFISVFRNSQISKDYMDLSLTDSSDDSNKFNVSFPILLTDIIDVG